MENHPFPPLLTGNPPIATDSQPSVAQLVGRVYEAAPPAERSRLISYLLQPLGALALVSVANGIFASIRFNSDWSMVQGRLENAKRVQASDVVALADRVQQVSVTALDGLTRIVSGSPVMASSAAAALLVAVLIQHSRSRRAQESEADDSD